MSDKSEGVTKTPAVWNNTHPSFVVLWAHTSQYYHTKMACKRRRSGSIDDEVVMAAGLAMTHNTNMLAAVGQGLLDNIDANYSNNPDGGPVRKGIYDTALEEKQTFAVH